MSHECGPEKDHFNGRLSVYALKRRIPRLKKALKAATHPEHIGLIEEELQKVDTELRRRKVESDV